MKSTLILHCHWPISSKLRSESCQREREGLSVSEHENKSVSAPSVRFDGRMKSYTYTLTQKSFLDAFSHLYKRVCPSVRPLVRPSVPNKLKSRKRAILSKVRVKDGIENECMTNQATVKSPGTIISASTSTKTSKISVEVPARQRTHLWSELCSTC